MALLKLQTTLLDERAYQTDLTVVFSGVGGGDSQLLLLTLCPPSVRPPQKSPPKKRQKNVFGPERAFSFLRALLFSLLP